LKPVTRGTFISFEGGEGAGKSTQIRRLAERLKADGADVVLTREPGGSPGAEQIRDLILNGDVDRWSPVTETLLMYASRRDHIERVIRPALERGAIVLCDRFADSTRAYQGAGGEAPIGLIKALEEHVLGGTIPDLTLIFDIPAETGLSRALARAARRASSPRAWRSIQRLGEAFLEIARREPERCVVIEADDAIDAVWADVWAAVSTRLGL
jgi:dTMP kinase